jgi:hypothetical protein
MWYLVDADHGLYERMPPDMRTALCGLWVAVVENNHKEHLHILHTCVFAEYFEYLNTHNLLKGERPVGAFIFNTYLL